MFLASQRCSVTELHSTLTLQLLRELLQADFAVIRQTLEWVGTSPHLAAAAAVVASELFPAMFLFEVFLGLECWDALDMCKIFAQRCIHHMGRVQSI
jgi:hypothetical protein